MKTTKKVVTLEDTRVKAGGGRYLFAIPKALVDTGVLAGDKRYDIVINEVMNDVVWGFSTPKEAMMA